MLPACCEPAGSVPDAAGGTVAGVAGCAAAAAACAAAGCSAGGAAPASAVTSAAGSACATSAVPGDTLSRPTSGLSVILRPQVNTLQLPDQNSTTQAKLFQEP